MIPPVRHEIFWAGSWVLFTWVVYVLVDPRDGRHRYAGRTKDPEARLRHHHYLASRGGNNVPLYEWMREARAKSGKYPEMELLSVGSAGDGAAEERAAIRELGAHALNQVRYLEWYNESKEAIARRTKRQVAAVKAALSIDPPTPTLGEWVRKRVTVRRDRKNAAVEARIVAQLSLHDVQTSRELARHIYGQEDVYTLQAIRTILNELRRGGHVVKEYPNGKTAGRLGAWTVRGAAPLSEAGSSAVDLGLFEFVGKTGKSFRVLLLETDPRIEVVVPVSVVMSIDSLDEGRLLVLPAWANKIGAATPAV